MYMQHANKFQRFLYIVAQFRIAHSVTAVQQCDWLQKQLHHMTSRFILWNTAAIWLAHFIKQSVAVQSAIR